MKRLFIPLLILVCVASACSSDGGGETVRPVDKLLTDPQVGLSDLVDYHVALTISFKGSVAGQTMESVETYTQSEWPSLEAQFTTIDTTDENGEPLFIVVGDVGEAHYDQIGRDSACAVRWGPSAGGPSTFHPAVLLDPVGAAQPAGEEIVEGNSTHHYTFDGASLALPEGAQASGEVWIADEGGYVVKYSLEIIAGDSFFGEGKQGTLQFNYRLSEVGAHPQVVYPDGCRPVLTDMLAMEDATEIVRLPGLLYFNSSSNQEDITSFYSDLLVSRGWEKVGDYQQEGQEALLIFASQDSEATAMVAVMPNEDASWVTINVFSEEPTTDTVPESGTTQASDANVNPALRVASGFSILLGMDSSQPGPPSYHLESYHQAPAWENGRVVQYEDWMIADVQGQDVHFSDRVSDPDGSVTTSEAYLIGGEEYDVENGVVQPPGVSMTGLAWALWPLDPVVVLGTGASSAQAAGSEVLDGRTAEVYSVDAQGAMGGVAGVTLAVTSVSGRIWIDQETGALLKAELDYQADVKDADGNVMGSGSGRLEINVTQVGTTSVSLPNQ